MQERTKSAANSSEIVLNDWAVYCRPPSSGCLFSMAPAFILPPSMSCKSQNHWPWEQPIDLCPSLTVGTTGQQSHDQNTVSFEEYEIRWASETQTLPWKLQTQKHHLEYFVDLNITVTTTNCRCQNDRGNYGAGNKLAVTIQTGDVRAACVESKSRSQLSTSVQITKLSSEWALALQRGQKGSELVEKKMLKNKEENLKKKK